MAKVLMFGFGALPPDGLRVMAPGLRTWHLLSALLSAGHEVCLIADRFHGSNFAGLPELVTRQETGWTYHSVSHVFWLNPAALRPLVKASGAACAIAVTAPAAAIATEVIGDMPLWADLYGSNMAEGQMKALVYGDDDLLVQFWEQECKAIERADIFSAVSERQQWSTIGELGMWGRLNQWTSGYEFVVTIPISSETTPYAVPLRHVIRGIYADENAFVILFSGGYNTWTDVDTLFTALEMVMAECPEVVFVSIGGKIDGHDDLTYVHFQSLIGHSVYRDRFHLCGWVASEDVSAYYLESNLGLNVDRISYEALLGSRTRILDWMRAGLPGVSSSLTELAQTIVANGGGLVYQPGNAQDLARCLRECASDRVATSKMGTRARQILLERFTFEATSERLRAWVTNPKHAPDYGRKVPKLIGAARPGLGVDRHSIDKFGLSRRLHWFANLGRRAVPLKYLPYHAQFTSYQVPDRMQPGHVYQCEVQVRNGGETPWLTHRTNRAGINLGYHWLTIDGTPAVWDGIRTRLPVDLAPGLTAGLTLRVIPPEQPGTYLLELDMVQEGVTWFSKRGSPGPTVTVEVQFPQQPDHSLQSIVRPN